MINGAAASNALKHFGARLKIRYPWHTAACPALPWRKLALLALSLCDRAIAALGRSTVAGPTVDASDLATGLGILRCF